MFQGTKVQAVEWLKTTVDPKHYQYNPPNLRTVASFNQNFTVLGKHICDDSALQNEKVPTSTGVFLWLCNRGLESLYNFGIVPMGTTTDTTLFSDSGLTIPSTLYKFTFNSETILPYSIESGKQVNISPDPETNFTVTRQIGGVISAFTDTAPAGIFAINGKLSAGTVQDTRDICQRNGKAFQAVDICQQSLTNKDQFAASKIFNGATFTVGSDVELDYSVPNRDNYYSTAGGASNVTLTNLYAGDVTVNVADGSAISSYQPLMFATFSPWNVNASSVQPAQAGNVYDYTTVQSFYELPNINICGDMAFEVSIAFDAKLAAHEFSLIPNCSVAFSCTAIHYYGSLDGDGTIKIRRSETECQQEVFTLGDQIQPVAGGATFQCTTGLLAPLYGSPIPAHDAYAYAHHRMRFKFDGTRKPTSLGEHGMYINTVMRLDVVGLSRTAATVVTSGVYSDKDLHITLDTANCNVRCFARNIYAPGELGPCRVLRYDDLSKDMDIQFQGDILVECVPQGQVAPFVKQGGQVSGITTSPSVFPLISAIYNSNRCPIKRVWLYQEYMDFVQDQVANLSLETIMTWMDDNPAIKEVVTTEAGGGWGSLLGNIGSTLGQSAGDALGGALGGLIGGLGASGQYGSASGQYGAQGMFAGGMYNSPVNPLLSNNSVSGNPYRASGNYSQDGTAARRRTRY